MEVSLLLLLTSLVVRQCATSGECTYASSSSQNEVRKHIFCGTPSRVVEDPAGTATSLLCNRPGLLTRFLCRKVRRLRTPLLLLPFADCRLGSAQGCRVRIAHRQMPAPE